jgi:hypothetical protein
MNLENHINNSFPDGLSYNETAQLCLHLYCTAENLPKALHSQCNKDDLAEVFAKLANNDFINGDDLFSTLYGANYHAISDKGHWIEVIASIFKIGDTTDEKIRLKLLNKLKTNINSVG